VHAVLKATVKALRLMRQSKPTAIRAMQRFARVDGSYAERAYDDLISTFNVDGTVDEETQRNDLAVIREITRATAPMPISQGYDFSIVRAVNRELNETGWRP
jgi:hypothetical protein